MPLNPLNPGDPRAPKPLLFAIIVWFVQPMETDNDSGIIMEFINGCAKQMIIKAHLLQKKPRTGQSLCQGGC